MSLPISSTTVCIRLVCELAEGICFARRLAERRENAPTEEILFTSAAILTRIVNSALAAAELGSNSLEIKSDIKELECAVRHLDILISTGQAASEQRARFEMIVYAYASSYFRYRRSKEERESYKLLAANELFNDGRSTVEIELPSTADSSTEDGTILTTTVTHDELKSIIDGQSSIVHDFQLIELLSRSFLLKSISGDAIALYRRLADRLQAHQEDDVAHFNFPEGEMPIPAGPHMPANQSINIDPFNLAAGREIPAELHEDVVFRKYICPITQTPIRHPVGDPNGVNIYEHSAILSWLGNHAQSPMTRAPLTPHQLLPKPALEAVISSRLQFHSDRLRAVAAMNAQEPGDMQLEAAAFTETPALT